MPQSEIWQSMTKSRPNTERYGWGVLLNVSRHSRVMHTGLVLCLSVIFV